MQITYNGITLTFQRVIAADDRIEYTDDGVDALRVRRELTVEAVVNTGSGLGLLGETWPQTINRVEAALGQPRKPLRVDWGGGVWLAVDADTDLKNGPTPQGVRFTQFAGADSATLQFSIVCHTAVCPARGPFPQWISHRWGERLAIDPQTWAKTWTRSGELVIRPGAGGLNAGAFLGVVTPPVRKGYLRTRPPEYELAKDGLSLRYTFADEEQYAMPPPGAVRAAGSASVTANMGIYRHCEVSVKLTGDVKQDKYALFEIATLVATTKLQDMGVKREKNGTLPLLQGALRTDLYQPTVEVFFKAYLTPPGPLVPESVDNTIRSVGQGLLYGGAALFNLLPGVFIGQALGSLFQKKEQKPGDEPDEDGGNWLPKGATPPQGMSRKPWGYDADPPDPGTGGGGIELLAAALQDPCLAPPQVAALGGAGAPPDEGRWSELRPEPRDKGELRADPDGPFFRPPGDDPAEQDPAAGEEAARQAVPWLAEPRLVVQEVPDWYQYPQPVIRVVREDGVRQPAGERLSALYTDYRIRQRVVEDEGYVGRTEQRAGGLTHFIRVKAKRVELVVDWTAERVGEPPQVLPQSFGDANFVYLGCERDPGTWETGEDGVTSVIRVSGSYRYGVKDPATAEIGMSIAPWVAELMGKGSVPLCGPNTPQAVDPATGEPKSMEDLRSWRDGEEPPQPQSA